MCSLDLIGVLGTHDHILLLTDVCMKYLLVTFVSWSIRWLLFDSWPFYSPNFLFVLQNFCFWTEFVLHVAVLFAGFYPIPKLLVFLTHLAMYSLCGFLLQVLNWLLRYSHLFVGRVSFHILQIELKSSSSRFPQACICGQGLDLLEKSRAVPTCVV